MSNSTRDMVKREESKFSVYKTEPIISYTSEHKPHLFGWPRDYHQSWLAIWYKAAGQRDVVSSGKLIGALRDGHDKGMDTRPRYQTCTGNTPRFQTGNIIYMMFGDGQRRKIYRLGMSSNNSLDLQQPYYRTHTRLLRNRPRAHTRISIEHKVLLKLQNINISKFNFNIKYMFIMYLIKKQTYFWVVLR